MGVVGGLILAVVLVGVLAPSDPVALVMDNAASVAVIRAYLTQDAAEIDRAVAWAEAALEHNGPSAQRHLRVAQAALVSNEPERALAVLPEPANPNDAPEGYLYWLGRAYDQAGDRMRATRYWALVGDHSRVTALAERLRDAGEYQASIDEYTRILQVVPGYVPALRGRGLTHLCTARWAEASSEFEAVLEQEPDDVTALVGLGTSGYNLDGKADRAIALIRRAIDLSPTCEWCYLNLADVYAREGRRAEAFEACTAGRGHRCDTLR